MLRAGGLSPAGLVVPRHTQGLKPGLSACGGDARGHQLGGDGGLLSWRSSLSPGVLGAAGACLRDTALLPIRGVPDVTGVTTPPTS